MKSSVHTSDIIRFSGGAVTTEKDITAIESPLQIILSAPRSKPPVIQKNISITMRTPGYDNELAVGFLFTEGILHPDALIREIVQMDENRLHIILEEDGDLDITRLDRHFYTSSSCGVCGKASIDAIEATPMIDSGPGIFSVAHDVLRALPDLMRKKQDAFRDTGGIHAAALYDPDGRLIALREDVGRHNALDKLIGFGYLDNRLPWDTHILLLSGRASFELIQKAAMAGIRFVAAVGAPSSLAVEMAVRFDMTLVGFLRSDRFNIYNAEKRIDL